MTVSDDDGFDVLCDLNAGPSRYFEDFELEETFYIPSRTMTEALFAAFQLASDDNDPITLRCELLPRARAQAPLGAWYAGHDPDSGGRWYILATSGGLTFGHD